MVQKTVGVFFRPFWCPISSSLSGDSGCDLVVKIRTCSETPAFARKSRNSKVDMEYKTVMRPVDVTKTGTVDILSAEISGTFDGSPVVLKYHFEIDDGLIQSLKITG